jgi:type IV pilus assembly protein PilO
MAEGAFFEKVEKIKLPIRILILVATLALIGGAFFFLVYQPKSAQIDKTETQIADLDREIRRVKIKAKEIKQLLEDEKKVDADLEEALKLLPDKAEIPALLKTITKHGADSNLQFRLFSPKKEQSEAFYYKLPVAVQVAGNYHDVSLFFDKVGKMERIVNILNVNMRPVKANATQLVTDCEAVTYRFKEKGDEEPKRKKRKRKR